MCLEANNDMSHYEMQQFLWRRVARFADYARTEQRLPNNKKADVLYQVGPTTIIIEVKATLKESLFENAYRKYANYCDYLVIATPPQFASQSRRSPLSITANAALDKIGVWLVDWLEIWEDRPACRLQMQAPAATVRMPPAWSPCTVIASPGCTVPAP